LTFVVGASQAIAWFDECVVGLRSGSVVSMVRHSEIPSEDNVLCRVALIRVVYGVSESQDSQTGASGTTIDSKEFNSSHENVSSGLVPSPTECMRRAEAARVDANQIIVMKDIAVKKLRSVLRMYHESLYWNRRAGNLADKQLSARVLLYIALVLGKFGDWRSVLIYCDAALELDPNNAKAYFRRGQAGSKLGFHLRSIRDLDRAADLCPTDSCIQKELAVARNASASLLKNTRQQFAEVYNVMIQSPIYRAAKT